MSGMRGSVSGPMPATSTRARTNPSFVSSSHRRSRSRQVAASTEQFSLMRGRTPNSSAQRRRYAQISGCDE